MSSLRNGRTKKAALVTAIVLAFTTAVSTAVIAAHSFTDVPDSNTFHEDIAWLKDNRVTIGCNPPANTEYCPDDSVTRAQMSAFMRRLAGTFGAVGDQVTNTSSPITVDSTSFEELLTIQVTPKSDANVILNAHANIEVDTGGEGRFIVRIAHDSCTGTVVGTGTWRVTQNEGAFPTTTISITGADTVGATTDYVLCAAKGSAPSLDGTFDGRGLTATWSPTP